MAHPVEHRFERAAEVDGAAGVEPNCDVESKRHRVQRRISDAVVRSQSDDRNRADAAFAQIAGKAGRGLPVVFQESRIAVEFWAKPLADDQLCFGPVHLRMEFRATRPLNAMIRP